MVRVKYIARRRVGSSYAVTEEEKSPVLSPENTVEDEETVEEKNPIRATRKSMRITPKTNGMKKGEAPIDVDQSTTTPAKKRRVTKASPTQKNPDETPESQPLVTDAFIADKVQSTPQSSPGDKVQNPSPGNTTVGPYKIPESLVPQFESLGPKTTESTTPLVDKHPVETETNEAPIDPTTNNTPYNPKTR